MNTKHEPAAQNARHARSPAVQGEARSQGPSISSDGRYVAFVSIAPDLVPGDTNEASDVFVHDRRTGTTRRVSVGAGGTQGDADSFGPSVSEDGRFVAFTSDADNLVARDTNGCFDVFVRDLVKGTTERVSVGADRAQGDEMSFRTTMSADGRFVTFTSGATDLVPRDTNGKWDVFLRDRKKDTTERISTAADAGGSDGDSKGSAISADGRFVAFASSGANLLSPAAGSDTNGVDDVFVRDRRKGTTERVSVGADGSQGNSTSAGWSISADGRFVAFGSRAANLVPGDTNGATDVFVRDRDNGTTERVSVGADGAQAGAAAHFIPLLSGDGRRVAFASSAPNLVPGDTNGYWDMFVRDRRKGTTERVSVGEAGVEGDGESATDSVGVGISADGRFTTFVSAADNLVPGDTNGSTDVFLRDLKRASTERPSAGREVQARHATGPAADARADGASADRPGYIVVQDLTGGRVLAADPEVTDKRSLLDGPLRTGAVGAAGRAAANPLLDNDHVLSLKGSRSVAPPGGTSGLVSVTGRSHLRVPFFSRGVASFTDTSSRVAWEGQGPFRADKVIHTDHWRVDAYPSSATAVGGPQGARADAADGLTWTTEVDDTWLTEHSWDKVTFSAPGVLYRSSYEVTGTFRFGTSYFVATAKDRAST
ncbi:TolB family protein [Wenjunlia tyrosinilytica]|uniref:TolB family protein n=1 Tax=Wenjunlia tyrosinilytica TaxID=1544741 RepID=UPI001665274C|nr:PD40 domain-containing protein [Wenjunlia tyrosinilytica]